MKQNKFFTFNAVLWITISVLIFSCNTNHQKREISLGKWIFTLHIDEKQNDLVLPFNVEFIDRHHLIVKNADERIEVSEIKYEKDSISIIMPVFGSEFKGIYTQNSIKGFWHKYNRNEDYKIPFTATYTDKARFETKSEANVNASGNWRSYFLGEQNDSSEAIGIFKQKGNIVTGTFLTDVGDYRHLEGVLDGNKLKLSCFDGAHAFLFEATISNDSSLNGSFLSGHQYKVDWIAHKEENPELGDMKKLTYLKPDYDKLEFSFPDESGNKVALDDKKYKNKVVIVQIFGTWCPNCMDETRFLVDLYNKHHKQGLEIIGLDFEPKPTMEYFKSRIARFKKDLSVPYTLLLAGKANKEEAAKALPMLNHILSYPTAIIMDRKGEIREIHTGFTGPGTGDAYIKYAEEFEQLITQLLEE